VDINHRHEKQKHAHGALRHTHTPKGERDVDEMIILKRSEQIYAFVEALHRVQ